MMLSKNEWTCDHCGAVVPTGILNVAKYTVEECPVTARKVIFDGKPITEDEFAIIDHIIKLEAHDMAEGEVLVEVNKLLDQLEAKQVV